MGLWGQGVLPMSEVILEGELLPMNGDLLQVCIDVEEGDLVVGVVLAQQEGQG